MQVEGKSHYKIYEIDLSNEDWKAKMEEAFDEVFLKRTEFYQLLLEKQKKDQQ